MLGDFNKTVRLLRKKASPGYPVHVRRTILRDSKGKDEFGDCGFENGKYIIRVNKRLSQDAQILILLHEWAHAICWRVVDHPETQTHGAAFGHAYSLVWRIFSGELDSLEDRSDS